MDDNRAGALDVMFARFADGTRWSTPRRLNDDAPKNRAGQFYPRLSIASGGRIDVARYDYRDDPYSPPTPEPGKSLNLFDNMGMHRAST